MRFPVSAFCEARVHENLEKLASQFWPLCIRPFRGFRPENSITCYLDVQIGCVSPPPPSVKRGSTKTWRNLQASFGLCASGPFEGSAPKTALPATWMFTEFLPERWV